MYSDRLLRMKMPIIYKIERGGKITVYYVITDKKNKLIMFESQLLLARGKEVCRTQQSKVKLAIKVMKLSKKIEVYDKKEREKDLANKKERQRSLDERQKLLKRIVKIEQRNKQFVTLTRLVPFIAFLFFAVMFSSIISSIVLSSKIQTVSLQNTQKVNNLNFNLTESVGKINYDSLKSIHDIQTILKELRDEITEIKQKSSQGLKGVREELMNQIRNIEQKLSEKSLYEKYKLRFRIQGARVKHIDNLMWHPQLSNYQIKHNKSAQFRINVMGTWNWQIMAEVMNYLSKKKERKFHELGNAMPYYDQEGRKYSPNTCQENEFRQGDIVQVVADRTRDSVQISWNINGQLEASVSNNIFDDEIKDFMSDVEMRNQQETVEWIVSGGQF